MHGIYYVLATLPIWATATILYVITMVVILVLRDRLEGIPYNVSYSAVVGDAGLVICVLIAATILRRGWVYAPSVHTGSIVQATILFLCMALGILVNRLTKDSRSGQVADIYHDIVIAPMILFFAIMLAPVIYYYGTSVEKGTVIGFILIWLALVGFDVKHKRMDQRSWLKRMGVVFKN